LPNTSATIKYIVKSEDTIKSISQDVCGNNTFYLKNISKQLNAGDTIEIRCK